MGCKGASKGARGRGDKGGMRASGLWKRKRMEVDKWLDGHPKAAAIQTKVL